MKLFKSNINDIFGRIFQRKSLTNKTYMGNNLAILHKVIWWYLLIRVLLFPNLQINNYSIVLDKQMQIGHIIYIL